MQEAIRLLSQNLADRERLRDPVTRKPWPPGTGSRRLSWQKVRARTLSHTTSGRCPTVRKCSGGTIQTRSRPREPSRRLPGGRTNAGRDAALPGVLRRFGAMLGPDHADTLARLANLAHLYYAAGRIGDAIALLRDTATRCERVLPSDDPLARTVQQSLVNLADS